MFYVKTLQKYFIILLVLHNPVLLNVCFSYNGVLKEINSSVSVNEQDSLALVALYKATDGPNWTRNDNWLTGPVSSWYGVQVVDNRVNSLELSWNNLKGEIPKEFFELTNLNTLDLIFNVIVGNLFDEIGNLEKLEYFRIGSNGLNGGGKITGSIPSSLGTLLNLKHLTIADNGITGSIPSSLGDLINLEELYISGNNIVGTIPVEFGKLQNLEELWISETNINGSIPNELYQLNNLVGLHLTYNHQLKGNISPQISNLENIETIDFTNNQITGNIPKEIGLLKNLTHLHLGGNNLTGEIPVQIYDAENLETLDLQSNNIKGTINANINKLTKLNNLDLRENALSGEIPSSLFQIQNLQAVSLQANNLTGHIPNTIGDAVNLEQLWLQDNNLIGAIPNEIGLNIKLENLYLDNNLLDGVIPNSFRNLKNLENCNLSANLFSQFFPYEKINLPGLNYFRLNSNKLTFDDFEANMDLFANINHYTPQANIGQAKTVTINEGSSYILDVECGGSANTYQWYFNNQPLGSSSSNSSFELKDLTSTDAGAYFCRVTNSIVTGLTIESEPITLQVKSVCNREQDSLALVAFYNATNGDNWTNNVNWLTGNLDTWYGVETDGCNVTKLSLQDNNLNGTIPSEIGQLLYLKDLNLNANNLSGEIPTEIGNLSQLTDLAFYGNKISGNLPKEIGQLLLLRQLWISHNEISGSIPEEIGNLENLQHLYLDYNSFTGNIPQTFGNLKNLIVLGVASNELSGAIPVELENLGKLKAIFFDNNKFNEFLSTLFLVDTPFDPVMLENNQFTFEDLENKMNVNHNNFSYFPQANIGQAQTISLDEGSSYSLAVECGGTANSYQWYFNNQPLGSPSSSSSLDLSNVTIADGGEYYCKVTNSIVTNLTIESEPITLQINQTNQAPTNLELSNTSIEENLPAGTVVGNLTTTDSDSDDAFTYSMVSGAGDTDNASFYISSDQLVSNEVFAFETKSQYSVRIQTTDRQGATFEKSFQLTIIDVNECNRTQDSLALVALYNSTDGDNWKRNDNWLTGNLDTWFGITTDGCNVTIVDLRDNNLNGSLPNEIGNLSNLSHLMLPDNKLSGSIPIEMGQLSNLKDLSLHRNKLSGNIPKEIGSITGLQILGLESNELSGSIPPELGNLKELQTLALGFNQLSGAIPPELGQLESVQQFYLGVNNLTGSIPPELGQLDNVWWLMLANNNLVGTIPKELAQMDNLRQLWLGNNQLTGEVPSELGNATTITQILLESNLLTGSIPPELGQLSELVDLRLYENQLEGTIPKELMQLEKLEKVYLNQNLFTDLPVGLNFSSPLLTNVNLSSNRLTFEDLEDKMNLVSIDFQYSPQATIGQSQTISLNEGDSYTLNISCGGTANTYQWYFNGQPLGSSSSSSSLNLSNVTIADGGEYYCKVTNSIVTNLTIESEPITLKINQTNQTPTNLELSNTNIEENLPAGTVVGNLTTTDPDSDDAFTYSLVSGSGDTDNNSFSISGDQLLSNEVFDYEVKTDYSVRIRTTDSQGETYEAAFTINISEDRTIYYISTTGSDENGDGSLQDPYSTIQFGIDQTTDHDTVLVLPGTFYENINYQGKDIIVGSRSLLTADTSYISQTIIDGGQNGSTVSFVNGEDSTATLFGLIATNGKTPDFGGGILCLSSDATIKNCIIKNNTSIDGGGLYSEDANLTIVDCTFKDNNGGYGSGGGICISDNCEVLVNNCTFLRNHSEWGGGGFSTNGDEEPSNIVITNSIFAFNTASFYGGGLMVANDDEALIENCLVYNNGFGSGHDKTDYGGGISITRKSKIISCTIFNNQSVYFGGGIQCFSNTIANSIIRGNSPDQIQNEHSPDVTYCNVQGGWVGTGNIDADPVFVDSQDEDFHLQQSSPNIDAGNNDYVNLNTDIEGNVRILDGNTDNAAIVDIGAYEFVATSCDTPAMPDTVDGPTTVQADATNITYSIAAIADATSYFWAVPTDATISSGQSSTEITVDFGTTSGNISVKALNDCGGSDEQKLGVTININHPPTDIQLSNLTIDEKHPIGTFIGTFSSTDADTEDTFSYSLISGEGDIDNLSFQIEGDSLFSNEIFDYNLQSSYSIRIQVEDNTGATFSKSFIISINEVEVQLKIPDVFTPNGDGYNDYFIVESVGFQSILVEIYNVWGVKVAEISQVDGNWDGTMIDGTNASEGIYYLYFKGIDISEQEYQKNGALTLIRGGVTISPNPVKEILSVNLGTLFTGEVDIYITMLQGNTVLRKSVHAQPTVRLNVGDLSQGSYSLRIVSEKQIYNVKFIKF